MPPIMNCSITGWNRAEKGKIVKTTEVSVENEAQKQTYRKETVP